MKCPVCHHELWGRFEGKMMQFQCVNCFEEWNAVELIEDGVVEAPELLEAIKEMLKEE